MKTTCFQEAPIPDKRIDPGPGHPDSIWDPKSSLWDFKDSPFIMTQNIIWRVLFAEELSRHSKNQFANSPPHPLHLILMFFGLSPILTPITPYDLLILIESRLASMEKNHSLVQLQRWKLVWRLFSLQVEDFMVMVYLFWGDFPHFSRDKYSHWLLLARRGAGVPLLPMPALPQWPRHAAFYKKGRSQAMVPKLCRARQRLSKGAEHSPF